MADCQCVVYASKEYACQTGSARLSLDEARILLYKCRPWSTEEVEKWTC